MRQALKWSHDINSALKMMADSTDANNLEQNKVIIYRITSKHTWRKTWAGKKRERIKPGKANKSSNLAMMNELHVHNMNLPLLLPLNQVLIYQLNLKIPKCLRMDVERGEQT